MDADAEAIDGASDRGSPRLGTPLADHAGISPAAALPLRFCAQCGHPGPTPGHTCRPPVAIGSPAPHTARRDLAAVRASLILYFSIIAASVLGVAATITELTDDAASEVAADAAAAGAISIVVLLACLRARTRLRPLLAVQGRARWYLIAPLASLGTFGLAHVACLSVADLFGLPEVAYAQPYLEAGWGWWLPVLLVCLQPAVVEELAFRGVMTSSLEPVLGPRETLFVVALLFAIIHLNPLAFVHLFITGLALGVLRNFSGSLYPCMLLHFCHNGLALLQEYRG